MLYLHYTYPTLALKLFRGEPAISEFDWNFSAIHSSSHAFSTATWFGPPRSFTLASTWPWIGHPVSGLLILTLRPLQTWFPFGSVLYQYLTSLALVTRRQFIISTIILFVTLFTLVPYMVYGVNGVTDFTEGFIQITIILMILGFFDRFFIDWYWVGHTKSWLIPGTEDLRPYIPVKMLIIKWLGTLVGYPLIALLIAKVMTFIV